MRAFVTGADGFIGSHLVEALRDRGDEVTGLAWYNARDSFGWMDDIEGIHRVRGDVRDAARMRELIAGHDIVFHLAALISIPYSYEAPQSYVDTNVTGTLSVLDACLRVDARLVHTSTSEVYGTAQYTPMDEAHPIRPQSPYAASKVAADALVRSFVLSYGMEAVTLRPFNTYGPRQSRRAVIASMCAQAAAGNDIVLGDNRPKRDWTYVSDTVNAFLAASGLVGGVYNAGSGEMFSVGALAICFTDHMIRKRGPERPAASEVWELCADATALHEATGWEAKISLADGVNETLDWWRGREPERLAAVA